MYNIYVHSHERQMHNFVIEEQPGTALGKCTSLVISDAEETVGKHTKPNKVETGIYKWPIVFQQT